jgi:hypothetical protein
MRQGELDRALNMAPDRRMVSEKHLRRAVARQDEAWANSKYNPRNQPRTAPRKPRGGRK